jgi:hypothetical protein
MFCQSCRSLLIVSARLFVAQENFGPFGTRARRREADAHAQALPYSIAFSRLPRVRTCPSLGKWVLIAVILVNAALTLSTISLVDVRHRYCTSSRACGSEEDGQES